MKDLPVARSLWFDAGLVLAAAVLLVTLAFPLLSGNLFDFEVFYASASAWLSGAQVYEPSRANLNPPAFIVLTGPLALLKAPIAWTLWQGAGLASFGVALKLARTADSASWRLTTLIVCAHAATSAQAVLGQVAWILTLPLVLAWRASSRNRALEAGAWLGLVVALKPFLLPLLGFGLVSRHWRTVALGALLSAAFITAFGAVVLGTDAYRAWVATGMGAFGSVRQPTLASLTGTLYTVGVGHFVGMAIAGLVVWIPVLAMLPRLDREQQWLAGLVASVLTSPLGWIHYVVWALPLACGTWERLHPRWRVLAVLAGTVHPALVAAAPIARPAYLASCVFLLLAALLPRPGPANARTEVERSLGAA